uniref:Non-haem dioxygenase N-terminal domain-containing protein n=1 Tax=Solanum lycopersicum TaxID=4081 RepID=A0A3Q7I291_SOLLC
MRLVDAGITKIPQIVILPPINRTDSSDSDGYNQPLRDVAKVSDASDTCGFFQVINHGIPIFVLDEMLQGDENFYKKDIKFKK